MARPTSIKKITDERRLRELAESEGYESAQQYVADLYYVHKVPFKELAARFGYTEITFRKRMKAWGIVMKSRGGRNNVRIGEVTKELVAECRRLGAPTVAKRMGVSYEALYLRLKQWCEENKEEVWWQ